MFHIDDSYKINNPFTGTSTISFFYTNDIVNRDDVMYNSYLKQKEFAKNDPRIDVVFVQNFSEAAKYLETKKEEGVSIQNVVFNAHGNLPNEKGTFNFGENPLREASDVDAKSFEKIGSLVNKNGIIVLLGCHTGGNNDVLGAVSVASGKRVIAGQPLVLPQMVFSGKRIFTTDRDNHPLETYLYTNMGTLATPASNLRGYKIENTTPFTIDIWGNVNFRIKK